MKYSKKELEKMVKQALIDGNWMIRRSDNGKSYNGFQWNSVGELTVAPDWNPEPKCGGGLHGNGPTSEGYWTQGKDVDFCIIVGDWVDIDGKTIKCKSAIIAMRNELPDNLSIGGSLDLDHTNIETLLDNISMVNSYLNLSHTNIKILPDNFTVNSYLNLSYTNIETLPDNFTVSGHLNLSHTNIKTLPDNFTVGGSLNLSYTNIEVLPDNLTVGGSLNLGHTNIKTLPESWSQDQKNRCYF